ncbi:hypothetical protein SHKM778_10040 [Streptomyces sp. KM77-8]|uniref:Beta-lactamase-related domain-containing protein n=1 Tax=Streptomyces haneummycinicus TaxID=3074435 RepID=A0AAT9HB53_9ACTN
MPLNAHRTRRTGHPDDGHKAPACMMSLRQVRQGRCRDADASGSDGRSRVPGTARPGPHRVPGPARPAYGHAPPAPGHPGRCPRGGPAGPGGSGSRYAEAGPGIGRADHFRAGSITKTFIATVVLQLADEGRLSLSDTVAKHLPGLVRGRATTAAP